MIKLIKESYGDLSDYLERHLDSWYGRLNELGDAIEDLGLDVDEINNEYVIVHATEPDGEDVYCKIWLGGTPRTISLETFEMLESVRRSKKAISEFYRYSYDNQRISNILDKIEQTNDQRKIDKAYDFINHACDNIDDCTETGFYDLSDASWGYGTDYIIEELTDILNESYNINGDDYEGFRESYNRLVDEGFEIDDDLQDIWDFVQEQEYDSAATSQNQLPGGVKAVAKANLLKPGTINLDYGGGRYDQAIEYLKELDVINLVFDPFNRTKEHNREVLDVIREAGGADSCTCCNVLNVIDGEAAKITALKNMKRLVKSGGKIYIQTYEGSDKVEVEDEKTGKKKKKASGVGKVTTKGWQENKETKMYLPIVQKVFSDAYYKSIKGVPLIICTA